MRYWKEALIAAFEDADIPLPSDEKLDQAASVLEGAHDNYGQSHGHDHIPNPIEQENKRLEKALQVEKSKVGCQTCQGTGRLESPVGTSHWSNTECYKCNGEGKVIP